MIIKNIEAKVRLATFLSAGSFILTALIVLMVSFFAYKQVSDARKTVYVLDANSVPLLARQTSV